MTEGKGETSPIGIEFLLSDECLRNVCEKDCEVVSRLRQELIQTRHRLESVEFDVKVLNALVTDQSSRKHSHSSSKKRRSGKYQVTRSGKHSLVDSGLITGIVMGAEKLNYLDLPKDSMVYFPKDMSPQEEKESVWTELAWEHLANESLSQKICAVKLPISQLAKAHFHVELGSNVDKDLQTSEQLFVRQNTWKEPQLEELQSYQHEYRDKFFGKHHRNYLGFTSDGDPVAVSILKEIEVESEYVINAEIRKSQSGESSSQSQEIESLLSPPRRPHRASQRSRSSQRYFYRVLIRSVDKDRTLLIETQPPRHHSSHGGDSSPVPPPSSSFGATGTQRSSKVKSTKLMKSLCEAVPVLQQSNMCRAKEESLLASDLLVFEDSQVVKHFKFGVLYAKSGADSELDMLSNCETTPAFSDFLDLLGNKVELDSWPLFRGGLDVGPSTTTGTHSVYTCIDGLEMMFHISTFLPFVPADPNQVERKRHIGNDIVIIIFVENDPPLEVHPDVLLSSHFNQVFAIVHLVNPGYAQNRSNPPENTQGAHACPTLPKYKVSFIVKKGTPPFGPLLPNPAVFEGNSDFRRSFLAKCCNAERAACANAHISPHVVRTRRQLLQRSLERHGKVMPLKRNALKKQQQIQQQKEFAGTTTR